MSFTSSRTSKVGIEVRTNGRCSLALAIHDDDAGALGLPSRVVHVDVCALHVARGAEEVLEVLPADVGAHLRWVVPAQRQRRALCAILVSINARPGNTHARDVETAGAGRGKDGRNAAVAAAASSCRRTAVPARDIRGARERLPARDGGLAVSCLLLAVLCDRKGRGELVIGNWTKGDVEAEE